MFINVVVKPEVGEIAYLYGAIRAIGGYPHLESIDGKIVEVSNGDIRIKNMAGMHPIHRVLWYTFGGIPTTNKMYDAVRVAKENDVMVENLKRRGELHV